MSKPLRVLMVEDSEDDALLLIRELKKGGYEPEYERVETAEAMSAALRQKPWDVILCDYQMPQFNGLAAITLLKETNIDIPVIIVSGTIGEETAVECMRLGARDYMMKGNLSRLALAIERELREVESRTQRKRAEEALRESEEKYRWMLDNMADVITVMDMNLRFTYVSPSVIRMRGYTNEEAVAQTFEQVVTPESLQISAKVFEEEMRLEAIGTADPDRVRIVVLEQYRKDGSIVLMENHLSFLRDKAKKPVGIISVSRDITQRKRAEEKLKDTLESLRRAVNTTIQVMVSAVEARDPYTSGHQIRSANLASAIAMEMGLPQDKIDAISMAGSIHDIGKISIPAEILSKPTKLSEIEFSLIKAHSLKGYEMLKDVESPWPLAEIVYQHHERMDGSGYPRNLKGKDICMEARILSVADVVEAVASHRPYRAGLGIDAALNEIEKDRGIFYDEVVADACLRLFREKDFKLEGASL